MVDLLGRRSAEGKGQLGLDVVRRVVVLAVVMVVATRIMLLCAGVAVVGWLLVMMTAWIGNVGVSSHSGGEMCVRIGKMW